jgi:hypothetical protein
MMKYALIYGVIAGILVAVLTSGALAIGLLGHHSSPLFGYLIMLAALSMIFVGVKRYRDVECGGIIRFGPAFAVGLGIGVVASVIYVVNWEAYVAVTGIDFMRDYTASVLAGMKARGAPAAEIQATAAELQALAVSYNRPLNRFGMTFAEIFPVALIVALISAALLRNPRLLPAVAR